MLENKTALVFAATGAIGGEVARTFAAHGATVYASGRDQGALDGLKSEVAGLGGKIQVDVVDATSEDEVAAYVGRVGDGAGGIDVVFNGIGGRPANLKYPAATATLSLEDFMVPQEKILASTFVTSKVAGAAMAAQGSGSIVNLSASLSGVPIPFMVALSATCGAIEALTRSLAAELSPGGVRVNCVRGDAMPETSTIQETMAGTARVLGVDVADAPPPPGTPLGRPISVAETAATAAFLASDLSSGTTAQVVDVGGRVMPG